MAALGDSLFYRRDQVDLDDALRHQVELLRGKVNGLAAALRTAVTTGLGGYWQEATNAQITAAKGK
jgi:hypothetical protein